MKCPKCQTANPEEAQHCMKCGARLPLPSEVFCSHCGAKNPTGSKFCLGCGRSLAIVPPVPSSRGTRSKPFVGVIVVLVVVVALAAVVYDYLSAQGSNGSNQASSQLSPGSLNPWAPIPTPGLDQPTSMAAPTAYPSSTLSPTPVSITTTPVRTPTPTGCQKAEGIWPQVDPAWHSGDWPLVLSQLEQVRSLCPGDPQVPDKLYVARYSYGLALLNSGKYVEAKQQCQSALDVNPLGADAKKCVEDANQALNKPTVSVDFLLYPVNRQNGLPASYVPNDLVTLTTVRTATPDQKLRRSVVPQLEKLIADARASGFNLLISSAYRSYAEQESTHAYWERLLGKPEADRISAEAGHSENQLGTAVCLAIVGVALDATDKFGATPEGKWVQANAYRYGFVLSYPVGKETVTGYLYLPDHIRYVGTEVATLIYQRGVTLHEYLQSSR